MFFLLTHPDGHRAFVRESYAPAAQTLIARKTDDSAWLQAIVRIPRSDGAPDVLLIEPSVSETGTPAVSVEPKPRKIKVKAKTNEMNGTD